MSFGFSIGDLLASAELCYKVARSIKDGPSQLKAARSSLRALITVLKRIEKDFEKLSLQLAMGEDTDRKEEFDDLMFGCRVTVRKFQKIVAKYDETGAGGKEMKMVGFKGLRWSLIDCKALPGIQCEIGMHLDSLNAIVNAQQR